MIFVETKLPGVFVIELKKVEDERGFFARTFCQQEFQARGLNPRLAQCSVSYNLKKGTIRGLHYQDFPHAEAKLVRCTRGTIYDVNLDLRSASPTFKQWEGVELSAGNRKSLYIPEGFAHGFQTLEDDTEVFYQISEFHHPECARGVRWDDPVFAIRWPHAPTVMSAKDREYPDFVV